MNEPQREVPPPPTRRTGTEQFMRDGEALGPTLNDFWAWSSSDLLSNALRGVLAEFIVGTALGCIADDNARVEWDASDLKLNDGTRIEVKSTAHVQSWGESKPGSLRFDIREATGWDASTNTSGTERKRNSEVYVFCVLTAVDRAGTLDLDNWVFYVASTTTLNARFEQQKSVRLSVLEVATEIRKCAYDDLRSEVLNVANGTSS